MKPSVVVNPSVVVFLRPVSDRDYHDLKVVVDLKHGNYNRAVKEAIRGASSLFPQNAVDHFEVLGIKIF